MAPYHAPPTKVLSSAPLSSPQAHAFLSTFTLTANDGGACQNEIVLTNLKRIEQALLGIHVPRPAKEDMSLEEGMTEMAAPIVGEEVLVEGVGEECVGGEENGEDEMRTLEDREDERNKVIPNIAVATSGKPKADKKADKKARRKEEKKARAEQRKKEKEEGSEDDDNE